VWRGVGGRSRFAGCRTTDVDGTGLPVAERFLPRLLGLTWLDREDAPPGLLIPRCRAVHTFGMRFEIEIVFLDGRGAEVRREPAVGPRRLLREPLARSVLELPAQAGAGDAAWVSPTGS
jgi:hypothetical protein